MWNICNQSYGFDHKVCVNCCRCKLVGDNFGYSGKVGRVCQLEFPLHDYVRGLSHAAAQYRVGVLFNGGAYRWSCLAIYFANGRLIKRFNASLFGHHQGVYLTSVPRQHVTFPTGHSAPVSASDFDGCPGSCGRLTGALLTRDAWYSLARYSQWGQCSFWVSTCILRIQTAFNTCSTLCYSYILCHHTLTWLTILSRSANAVTVCEETANLKVKSSGQRSLNGVS